MLVKSVMTGIGLFASAVSHGGDYSNHPQAQKFVDRMVDEHKFERKQVQEVLGQAQKKQSILEAIARPAEKTKPWHEYRKIFLGEDRVQQGIEFWTENAEALADSEKQFGVAPEVIVAIIGVETRYGRHMGSYRVIDALATLGFDYEPRAKFFNSQLEQLFLLAREQQQDPLILMGSYAGAMGYGQFIPSSYRSFARDFDNDGFADIWQNKRDAIASVANYFKAHGWQTGQPVMGRAHAAKGFDETLINDKARPSLTLNQLKEKGFTTDDNVKANQRAVPLMLELETGPEYWLGYNNFYVITRYNHSHLYATAVWQLAQAIKKARKATPL